MGCGCRKPPTITAAATRGSAAGGQVLHEVVVNGLSTGRKFTSLIAASEYARSKRRQNPTADVTIHPLS